MDVMTKEFWKLREELDAFFKEAAKAAIAETHAAGRPSAHGDEKGLYLLYPDGHKEYIKLYGEKRDSISELLDKGKNIFI